MPRPVLTIPRVTRFPDLEEFLRAAPPAGLEEGLAVVEGFTQREPRDGAPSSQLTRVRLAYDQQNLYVLFECLDTQPDKVRARMTKRDDPILREDDLVRLYLDTFHDQRRAYVFEVNPFGIQIDGVWAEGAEDYDRTFDTVWHSRGRLTDRGYAVWMAIPFKSLRFPDRPEQTWGIAFERIIPRANETAAWPHISSRTEGRLNQAAALGGLRNISPGRNVQLIPYGTMRSFRALDRRDPLRHRFVRRRAQSDGGVDAKLVFRDSLVLDVAVNPDFSQVESDEPQVTVNERFEVFFPEKRPFFIENTDYFETPINLVFTRRIADPSLGARLTGKLGRYSIGALLADDQAPGKAVPAGHALAGKRAHFGILRVSRDVFRQSRIGLVYTDREFNGSFNRVFGVDGRFKLGRNWVALFQAAGSETLGLDGRRLSGSAWDVKATRSGRQLSYEFEYKDRSPGFRTETGFLRRSDIRHLEQKVGYRFRPEGKYLISWGPLARTRAVFDHEGTRLDLFHDTSMIWELAGRTETGFWYAVARERLRMRDFPGLRQNRDFPTSIRGLFFETSVLPQITVRGHYGWGAGINLVPIAGSEPSAADLSGVDLAVTLRPDPRLSVENRYLLSRLLEKGGGAAIFNNHIVRSKWNWQFSPEISLRAIMQYDGVLANSARTSLETGKNLNVDFLLTYQVNPGTGLYLGYNGNWQNIDLVPTPTGASTIRTGSFRHDARGLFVKFLYLFRF